MAPARTLPTTRESLEAYRAAGGYEALEAARALPAAEVVRIVTESGLRGRGGAGFLVGRKWELARSAQGAPKAVVANGGEHEPGSKKDRWLVATMPHRVVEGIAICAHATGATIAYVYLIEDMADAIAGARTAIDEARAAGLLGGLDVQVTLAPTTYVAGEETAALEAIEGRPALPRQKPPYPGQAGLWGQPTTVNNVESLARVPAIVRGREAWGAGSMLCTLDDTVARPGVYDVPLGTTYRALVHDVGGGPRGGGAVKAILPARSSAFLPASALDTPMTHEAVQAAGSNLGCGGPSIVEEGTCMVELVTDIARFFVREQCGQCPPCRMETNTIAAVFTQVQAGTEADYRTAVERVAEFTRGKGRCGLIGMAAAPALSALRLFPEDFAHHAAHGKCR